MLFNGAMVRAILDGRKTQTRRALRDQNPVDLGAAMHGAHLRRQPMFDKVAQRVVGTSLVDVGCPFGHPGDRLWVRETWGVWDQGFDTAEESGFIVYRADTERPEPKRWRPSIHMPRSACRLVLKVTDVRVERLHAITAADCWAEGIPHSPAVDPRHEFEELWTSTGGDWVANPWVWVVGFRIAEGPVNG